MYYHTYTLILYHWLFSFVLKLCVCIWMQVPWRPREGIGFPGTGDNCELPDMGAGNQTLSSAIASAKLSLQSPPLHLLIGHYGFRGGIQQQLWVICQRWTCQPVWSRLMHILNFWHSRQLKQGPDFSASCCCLSYFFPLWEHRLAVLPGALVFGKGHGLVLQYFVAVNDVSCWWDTMFICQCKPLQKFLFLLCLLHIISLGLWGPQQTFIGSTG